MAIVYDDQPSAAPKSRIVYDDALSDEPKPQNWMERAAERETNAIKGSALYGAADIAGSGVLNLLGKIASGYHGLKDLVAGNGTDAAADTVNADRAAMHTEADSPGAQTLQNGVRALTRSPLLEAAGGAIDKGVANAGPGVSTFVPAAAEAAQDVAGILPAGGAARAAKAADAAAVVEGAAKPTVGDALGTVRGAGYKVLPSDVEARMGPRATVGQGAVEAAGGAGLRRDIQLHNQGRTQELAAEDMGIPKKPKLTPEDYDAARVPHYDTYKATGEAADLSKPTPNVIGDLNDIAGDQTPQGMVQPKIRNQITRVQNAMNTGNYTGTQLVKDVSYFRQNGARAVANALESEMERQLGAQGKGPELEAFRNARTSLAKIRNYQDASTGGVIDAQDFKRLSEKSPHLLTGNAKVIAQAGAELPGLTRLPTAARPKSALDQVLGLSKVATVVPKVADVVAGKIGASDFFQNRFGRVMTPTEQSYVPGFGRKPDAPSEALSLKAPPGRAGRDPSQGSLELPPGREPAPRLDLAPSEGTVGINPTQLGMQLAQGRAPAPQLDLAPPEGTVGVNPTQGSLTLPPNSGGRLPLGQFIAKGADARNLHRAMKRKETGADKPGSAHPHGKD